jgi:hypothetical protein
MEVGEWSGLPGSDHPAREIEALEEPEEWEGSLEDHRGAAPLQQRHIAHELDRVSHSSFRMDEYGTAARVLAAPAR